MGGVGWIAFALYRHFNPARPILTLSPAGISYHVPWLKDLTIPWHEIQAVDALERGGGPGIIPNRFDDTTVVLISTEFDERNILVRRTLLAGRGWYEMFIPKGSLMQMVLHFGLFSIPPQDIREPAEIKWEGVPGRAAARRRRGAGGLPRLRSLVGRWLALASGQVSRPAHRHHRDPGGLDRAAAPLGGCRAVMESWLWRREPVRLFERLQIRQQITDLVRLKLEGRHRG